MSIIFMYRNESQNCSLYIIHDWSRSTYLIYISTITYLSNTSMLAKAQIGIYLGPTVCFSSTAPLILPSYVNFLGCSPQHPQGGGLPCILACAGQVQIQATTTYAYIYPLVTGIGQAQ
jgi:hypothetical protein